MTMLVLEVAHFDNARHCDWQLLDASGLTVAYGEASLGQPSADCTQAVGRHGGSAALARRNPDQLTAGLDAPDDIDSAIVGQVLARLAVPQGDQLDDWASLGIGSESDRPLTW